MTNFQPTCELPSSGEALRQRIYQGEIFLLPVTAATQSLTKKLNVLAERHIFGEDNPSSQNTLTKAQSQLGVEQLRQGHGAIKKLLLENSEWDKCVWAILAELDFDLPQTAYDPLRMRLVADQDYKRAALQRSHSIHRDTWYANPQCQINFWMPLHSVDATNGFGFFLDYFDKAVANGSKSFDYDTWIKTVGWQNAQVQSDYPTVYDYELARLGEKSHFDAEAGQLLLFSAAHLHQTTANDTGEARFSVDFRAVDLKDLAAGRGANNADNLSQGNPVVDYRRCKTAGQ